jgi:hypothetical protein
MANANKVMLELKYPDALWVRGAVAPANGGVGYEARFCKSSAGRKVAHLGPTVTVSIVNVASGKPVSQKTHRLQISSDGTLTLEPVGETFEEVQAQIEKAAEKPAAEKAQA